MPQPSHDAPPNALPHPQTKPLPVVLDTNVVLDLLVFNDVRARALAAALQAGRLQALRSQAMLDELADVLSRPFVKPWCQDVAGVLAQAQALCQMVAEPPPTLPAAPRCADPDDQKFIDLAWAWPAAWLFSRDRAVLQLARAARLHGLGISTPAAWAAAGAAPA